MSERTSWIHVRAAGMDLLLSPLDLREVVAAGPVSPLPGRPPGIQGVIVYQGEFLPVLAWEGLPGCEASNLPTVAMVVLRPRLGIPIERMIGTLDLPEEGWLEPDVADAANSWLGGIWVEGDRRYLMLDSDRLMALLQRFRTER